MMMPPLPSPALPVKLEVFEARTLDPQVTAVPEMEQACAHSFEFAIYMIAKCVESRMVVLLGEAEVLVATVLVPHVTVVLEVEQTWADK
jgi:hypothetical protein